MFNPDEALERVAAYGGGTEVVWQIPEPAEIRLAEGQGHLLAGATITSWEASKTFPGASGSSIPNGDRS